jgi:hypothetical protein
MFGGDYLLSGLLGEKLCNSLLKGQETAGYRGTIWALPVEAVEPLLIRP